MTHPIIALQQALLAALFADAELIAALGGAYVFDAPPSGRGPPYAAITRHDVLSRDTDGAPGHDHRLLIQCWHPEPSRKAVLAIAERVVAVALAADLGGADLIVTHMQHDRTDTAIDLKTGYARAAIALRVFSEPVG
ncbi:MAG: DUF3168 domain-containing protein [Alphaproteobacteria bacterium]|nr:DUF3168 domain-containing protein [Alphaproteobacteria bacterium]